MKIAIVSTYPPKKCGIGIYTKRLADALSEHGSVKVISFKKFNYEDKKVVPLLEKNNFFSYFKAVDYIKKQKFDKILIEYEYLFYNPFLFLIFLLLLKIKNTKINLEMHTVVPYTDFVKKSIFTLYHSVMLVFIDKVIMHTSTAEKKLFSRTLVKKPVVILPMPVLVKKPKFKELKHKQKTKTLTCFGFVNIDKGIDIALKAFGGVQGTTLKIVGSVNPTSMKKQFVYYDKIKKEAKKFNNIIIIDRFISEKETHSLFKETDFFILPYRFIEQSAVLSHVWAYEKIPICSDIKPLKDQIKDKFGVLFKSEDSIDLRKAFVSINRNKKTQKTIVNNIKNLVKERGPDNYSKKLLKALA